MATAPLPQVVPLKEVSQAPYFDFSIQRDFSISLKLSVVAVFIVIGIILLIRLVMRLFDKYTGIDFEIDSAEFGTAQSKFVFKPNRDDQQIAYKIWVELSTRKIGLPIDLKDDVISEIYDSWYNFFSITRELIKDIPASKLKNKSTSSIVDLSIRVLNHGLRPHLTQWQARFRHWYDMQLKDAKGDFDPQSIQAKYPEFINLQKDLMKINGNLINYRNSMERLVLGISKNNFKNKKSEPSLSDQQ